MLNNFWLVVLLSGLFWHRIIVVIALSSSPTPQKTSLSSSSAIRQVATSWFSIATHLQNPTLYSADWAAYACHFCKETLVASRFVEEGEILSLVPMHAIGWRGGMMDTQTTTTTPNPNDWIVFDVDQEDSDYFQQQQQSSSSSKTKTGFGGGGKQRKSSARSPHPQNQKYPFRYAIPETQELPLSYDQLLWWIPTMQEDNNKGTLFCDVNPHRSLRPGWMGHLAAKQRTSSSSFKSGNCQIFPIALPLCALVATKEIMEGTTLELEAISTPPRSLPKKLILERYRPEIQELQEYMKMAFPKEPPPPPLHEDDDDDDDDDKVEAPQKEEPPSSFSKLHHPFYDFPLLGDAHPSATFVRTDPDILVVPNFLSDSECDRLIQKCRPHLVPCVTKNPRTGAVEEDGSRTSRNTNVPQEEVPSIVHKLTQLTNCDPEQLEVLQVLHYAPGQYFEPHTDGFAGPISACGFEASARLVTIFCYLNDVKQGGATRFSNLDLNIEPQKGLAVIHFPTTLGFEEDGRTHHEGMVAIDEKWLLVTWVWMHPRDQTSIYAEKWLDPLDDEII